jgi:group I intron endonuclease
VYAITHLASGRVYVGSASNISVRWKNHLITLRNKTHRNRFLQRAWNKYGESAFQWLIIEPASNAADLIAREQNWIDSLKASNPRHGYNAAPVAGSSLGVKHTPETIQKYRDAARARPPRSAEVNARFASFWKGRKQSAEHIANKASALRAYYARVPMSQETRAKMSASKKGIVWTAEQIARRLAWTRTPEGHSKFISMNIGRKLSPEHKAAISAANKGKQLSQEHRAKITAANLARWAKHRASTLLKGSPATTPCLLDSDRAAQRTGSEVPNEGCS